MSSTEFACGVRTSNFTYDKPAALLHSLQDFLWFLRTKSSVFCKSNESGINRSEISRKNFISLFSSFMSNLLWDAKDESGKPGFMFHFGASTKIITSSGRLIPLSRATSHAEARICLSCLFVSLFFFTAKQPPSLLAYTVHCHIDSYGACWRIRQNWHCALVIVWDVHCAPVQIFANWAFHWRNLWDEWINLDASYSARRTSVFALSIHDLASMWLNCLKWNILFSIVSSNFSKLDDNNRINARIVNRQSNEDNHRISISLANNNWITYLWIPLLRCVSSYSPLRLAPVVPFKLQCFETFDLHLRYGRLGESKRMHAY